MKTKLHYISSAFALLFITGVLLTSFHLHFDQSHGIDSDPPHYVEDHNFCTLCASQFQSVDDTNLQPESDLSSEEIVPDFSTLSVTAPLNLIQNYRAPPLFS